MTESGSTAGSNDGFQTSLTGVYKNGYARDKCALMPVVPSPARACIQDKRSAFRRWAVLAGRPGNNPEGI